MTSFQSIISCCSQMEYFMHKKKKIEFQNRHNSPWWICCWQELALKLNSLDCNYLQAVLIIYQIDTWLCNEVIIYHLCTHNQV